MKQQIENTKQQLEEVIKKILSENKGLPLDKLNGDLLERALRTMNFQLKQSLGREEITSASDTNVLTEKDAETINEIMRSETASLIADEVLKITKCNCCDEEDEHIFKDDRSTTRISRHCSGCGKHQTIAGALLKSKEWDKWYKYASENMLFDVDETLTVDAMSDEHWNSFMKFLNNEVLKVVVEKINSLGKGLPILEGDVWMGGFLGAKNDILELLK